MMMCAVRQNAYVITYIRDSERTPEMIQGVIERLGYVLENNIRNG